MFGPELTLHVPPHGRFTASLEAWDAAKALPRERLIREIQDLWGDDKYDEAYWEHYPDGALAMIVADAHPYPESRDLYGGMIDVRRLINDMEGRSDAEVGNRFRAFVVEAEHGDWDGWEINEEREAIHRLMEDFRLWMTHYEGD